MYCTIDENQVYIRNRHEIMCILTFSDPVRTAYLNGDRGYVVTYSGEKYEIVVDSYGNATYYPIF